MAHDNSPQLSDPSFASVKQESAYLLRARVLSRVRLSIALIILVTAASVAGLEGAPLSSYQQTASFEDVGLPLWPLNLDVRPTTASLACGVLILFQILIYIMMAVVPSPKARISFLHFLTAVVSLTGFVTALMGVVFSIYLPSSSYPAGFTSSETIHSWTCKWQSLNGITVTSPNGQPLTAPAGFSRMCTETTAGFALLCLLIALEIILGVSAVVGLWLDRKVSKQRKDVLEMETGTGR